jgi:ATP-dependent RNA helicase DeaD
MEIALEKILKSLGVEHLNSMQEKAFEGIVQHENTLLLSPTGSGKTLAFMLPVATLLMKNVTGVQCLVLAPTRELVQQLEAMWKKMQTNFKVNACYGGHSIQTEINNLSEPPVILIGTPGRVVDHIQKKSFDTATISMVVLDEFDKMLEIGFKEEMAFIFRSLLSLQKKVLISATAALEIPDFTSIESPFILNFLVENPDNDLLNTYVVKASKKDKYDTLFSLLCSLESRPTLIFCNHREAVERVSNLLNQAGIQTGIYHGGLDQIEREKALIQFANGSIHYLVATDIAARGLDISGVYHIIHYHLPALEKEFVHRNGRTARMHAAGNAYLIISPEEHQPEFIKDSLEEFVVSNSNRLPEPPNYQTLYISGGKKNKLNKTDIVGFFIQQGRLDKEDIHLITVKDFVSFVAVNRHKIKSLLQFIQHGKMKGKKYKIEVMK